MERSLHAGIVLHVGIYKEDTVYFLPYKAKI